jgi:hypothetical protein
MVIDKTKLDPSEYVYSETQETFSEWKNNNDVKAVFRLLTNEKRVGKNIRYGADCQGSTFRTIVIEPGHTIKLQKEYDQAIRTVSTATGLVVGGLCPWLTKIGEENITVHTSLDYKTAFQEEEAITLMKALKKENELREALKELEKRKLVEEKKTAVSPAPVSTYKK